MTTTPVILLIKRSGNSSDRPNASTIQAGECALSFGASDPGFYFKDSLGSIRKIGPSAYGTSAPNSSPLGSAGNSTGELWSDSSSSAYYLKVWTGSAWQKVGAGFADTANNAITANTALSANTATTANTALVANSAVVASGALFADSALVASGALFADSALVASGALVADSALIASGALVADSALIASGALAASGALTANSALIASGAITASGVESAAVIVSGLPAVGPSGALVYLNAGVSGLYVSVNGGWALT